MSAASPLLTPWRTAAAQPMSRVRPVAARDETCRQVLRSTAAGSHVRVRLSNALSSTPLVLTAVTVARRTVGAAVVGSRPLLVRGETRVRIPAGGRVLSDPVAVAVAPGTDVAVSFAVAGTGQLSEHPVSAATGWCTGPGTGDHTRDPAAGAFRIASREGLVVEALDVETSASTETAILAVGDSLTDPPLPPDHYQRWTDVLAARVGRPVVNAGIGGNRVLLPGGYGPTLAARFGSDVLDRSGASTLVLFAGTNDVSAGVRAADLISQLDSFCAQAHKAGLKVVLVTLAPAAHRLPQREVVRNEVNRWIRTTSAADARLDADALLRDPAAPDRLLASYDLGDGLHLSAFGHRVLGEAMAVVVGA